MDRIIRWASRAVQCLLAVFGIIQLFEWSKLTFGNFLGATCLIALVLVVLVGEFLLEWVLRPLAYRWFKVPQGSSRVIPEVRYDFAVDGAGGMTVRTERTYVFLKDPAPRNLFDTLHAVDRLDDKDVGDVYSSEDSACNGERRRGKDRLVVFWWPKIGVIHKLVPYRHQFTYRPTGSFRHEINYWMLAPLYPTGRMEVRFRTALPLKRVWTTRCPRPPKADGDWLRRLRGSKYSEDVPQPQRISSTEFSWTAEGLQKSAILIVWEHDVAAAQKSATGWLEA